MYVTLSVAIWGTALSLVCAVPCGLMCARNMAPQWVVQPVRRLMDACRAINEMVFAMLFIVAVGLGLAARKGDLTVRLRGSAWIRAVVLDGTIVSALGQLHERATVTPIKNGTMPRSTAPIRASHSSVKNFSTTLPASG